MSWLTEFLGPNPPVDEIVSRIGALLVVLRHHRAAREPLDVGRTPAACERPVHGQAQLLAVHTDAAPSDMVPPTNVLRTGSITVSAAIPSIRCPVSASLEVSCGSIHWPGSAANRRPRREEH